MIILTNKGFFFAGKIKDLQFQLKLLGSRHLTLRELIGKKLQ